MRAQNSKIQIPNSKQIPNTQAPKGAGARITDLEFGFWSFFGFWILGFGIFLP
jgi:hypothetical protein